MFSIALPAHGQGRATRELFADTAYIFDENTRFDLRRFVAPSTATGAKDGVMSATVASTAFGNRCWGLSHVVIVTNDGKRLTTPRRATCKASTRCQRLSVHARATWQDGVGHRFRSDPRSRA